VLDGKAHIWPGVKNAGFGEKVVDQLRDPFPRGVVLLTALPERASPQVRDVVAERAKCATVGRHRVICEETGDDLPQPLPLLGNRLVHPPSQFRLDLLELRPHAVAPALAPHPSSTLDAGMRDISY